MVLCYYLIPWLFYYLRRILTIKADISDVIKLVIVLSIYSISHPLAPLIISPLVLVYSMLSILTIKNRRRMSIFLKKLLLLVILFGGAYTIYYLYLLANNAWFLPNVLIRPSYEFKLYASHNVLDAISLTIRPPGQVIPQYTVLELSLIHI